MDRDHRDDLDVLRGGRPVGWTWVSLQTATVIIGLARICPMLAEIIACTRGQVLACLAPVASTWHTCQRGPGVSLAWFAAMVGISLLLGRQAPSRLK